MTRARQGTSRGRVMTKIYAVLKLPLCMSRIHFMPVFKWRLGSGLAQYLHRIFKTVVNKTEGLDGVYCKVLRAIF